MQKNVGGVDGLTRLIGGVPLVIGAVLALPGIDARTLETTMLWIALATGIIALISIFLGRCSWYAGFLISGASYALFAFRFAPSAVTQATVSLIGIVVGLGALFTRITKHCPINSIFHIHSS